MNYKLIVVTKYILALMQKIFDIVDKYKKKQEINKAYLEKEQEVALELIRACEKSDDTGLINDTGLIKKLAELGSANAQLVLGAKYQFGRSVDQNYKKAFEWYKKAADQGNVEAQYLVGLMYDSGYGIDKDYTKSFEWFEKAANQGHAEAQYLVGFMYYSGSGVEKDYKQAYEWYKKAADQGSEDAEKALIEYFD